MKLFKTNSITRRWILSVMLVVVGVVAGLVFVFALSISRYYQSTIKDYAMGYVSQFSRLAAASQADYASLARVYVEDFQDKDKLEVQLLDNSGRIIITSSGFPTADNWMPDYDSAMSSSSGTAYSIFKDARGERLMASTTVFPDYGSGSNGAMRWIVSLDRAERHVFLLTVIAAVIGLIVILFAFYIGMYFIRSIVVPIRNVSNTARKIALGDLNSRLEIQRDDEIGELCETINYMAGELQQADSIKNDFISSVSHELRTPLTAIQGWGETVKMSVGSDDELVKKGMDIVLSETARLSRLVEELLDFSRIQSGRLSLNMRETELAQCLSDAVDMYAELAHEKGLSLTLSMPDRLPPIIGDPDRLRQVFINLIDNAIKYTETGSVALDAVIEEGCVRITCKDTGIGIPSQDIDRVKQKFYKSNKSVHGSGIGLAVADEIVKQHNGLLFLESQENLGTTVTVVLPIKDEPAGDPAQNAN